jgi:hypothetical protein
MAKSSQVRGTIKLVPTFDCPTNLALTGKTPYGGGATGNQGAQGGMNQDGDGGGMGGAGANGEPGPDIEVRLAMRDTKRGKLAEVTVSAAGEAPLTFLIAPTSDFKIVSQGGSGGAGGRGGLGGTGGPIPPGPCEYLARGGTGGTGGPGGSGGAGGRIVVLYDPAYPELKKLVFGKSLGGKPGAGGKGGEGGSWGPPNANCSIAESGYLGKLGARGRDGAPGADGPAIEYIAGLGAAPRATRPAAVDTRPTTRPGGTAPPPQTKPVRGKPMRGTYTLSAGGSSVNGAVSITIDASAPAPRLAVDVLACTLETTPSGGSFKVVPMTCGTYAILDGTVSKSGAGYKVALAVQQTAMVKGKPRTVDGIFKVTVQP